MFPLLGSIPSPPDNQLDIGPLSLNYYGLCIGIGVLVAVWMGQRRWAARGGHPDDISAVATWAVPAGLVGARAYHVITDWRPIGEWLKVWEGGLGIPGGLVAGIAVGVWAARRRGMDLGHALDAGIPAIPVAHAIGRIGNWFNQEIFGGPSDLPWAVEIDPEHRPADHLDQATFHPAFLYEAIWNVALAAFLIWIDRRGTLRKGMVLPLYVMGYGIGRFLVETIRTDPATEILGVRVNHWVSAVAVLASAAALVILARRAGPSYFAPGGDGELVAASGPGDDTGEEAGAGDDDDIEDRHAAGDDDDTEDHGGSDDDDDSEDQDGEDESLGDGEEAGSDGTIRAP